MNEPLELDVNLSQIDTTFPVLKAGIKDMKVASITKEENKDKNGFNVVVTLETTEPDEDQNGKPVLPGQPGTKIKTYYALQPKADSADPEGWKKRLAQFQDAVLGTSQGTRPDKFASADYIGRVVRAVVDAKPGDNGNMQNSIKSLSYPT